MATNLRAPVTDDIWHLSIDDLLSPLPEKPRLGGPGPFVINLSSSTASIGLPNLNLAGCEGAHAYEIQRIEDGRTRYRLRLGPFDSEEAAEVLLDMVREIYPSALTATAAADDLKAITTIRTKAAAAVEARRPPPPQKSPEPPMVASRAEPKPATVAVTADKPIQAAMARFVEPPVINERVELAPVPPVPMRVAAKPAPVYVPPAAPMLPKHPESIWAALPVAPRAAVQTVVSAGTKPSMSVSAPLVRRTSNVAAPPARAATTSLKTPAAKLPVATPAAAPAATMPPVAKAPVAKHAAPAQQKPPSPPRIFQSDANLSFDSTQTMRVLTPKELEDDNARPWFVIELATAGEAFDPDTVPNLDIFVEYRLYSVAEAGSSSTVHALRVGFFSAEIAAKTVASYLAEYYDKPTVKRVSLAERERFAEQAVEARKDVGATGRHAVIEITDDLIARRKPSNARPASRTS